MNNPNLEILELVVATLGPVCDDVVFVGGCATGILLTQERPERIRVTEDVDIIAQTLTSRDYHAIEERVRAQGFTNDLRPDAPVCRYVHGKITVDLMPTDEKILGFANRWYTMAFETASPVQLPSGKTIRMIAPPLFIGTKLEAFKDRGRDADGKPDFLGSHDLEDIITVVDRRPELLAECLDAPLELRQYLAEEFKALIANENFVPSLSGHLPADGYSQVRVKRLRETLVRLSMLD